MSIGFLAFGFLCGVTAAILVLTAGAGLLAAFAAYSGIGAAGVLLFALPGTPDLTTA
jgi:hypothetical protein